MHLRLRLNLRGDTVSIFRNVDATCPECGATVSATVYASINADRAPELRQAILDRTLQAMACPNCDTPLLTDPSFSYVDLERGQWLLVKPMASLPQWSELEAEALRLFESAYGSEAPPAARRLGDGMRARIAFGWAAAREKILCQSQDIDDVALELVKLTLLRNATSIDLTRNADLRLIDADADTLTIGWLRDDVLDATLEVPRALLEAVTTPDWQEAVTAVTAGPYVDINRILVPNPA